VCIYRGEYVYVHMCKHLHTVFRKSKNTYPTELYMDCIAASFVVNVAMVVSRLYDPQGSIRTIIYAEMLTENFIDRLPHCIIMLMNEVSDA
jgi:hypothetical protein